jgi:hypothetical protein
METAKDKKTNKPKAAHATAPTTHTPKKSRSRLISKPYHQERERIGGIEA